METLLESSKYKIKIEDFEGPLDLLCHLVEKNKMDIYHIPINEITDQYMEYLHSMQELNLEVTGEFLVMASNLLYMKSKTLLPKEKEEEPEEEDLQEELVQRLVEYKKIKAATDALKKNEEAYEGFFYREPEKLVFPKEKPTLDRVYSGELIPETFMKIASENMNKINHNAKDINRLIESDKVTVRSKIKDILKGLMKNPKYIFNRFFSVKTKSKIEVITAFMAMLELNRASKVDIEQKTIFGDIELKRCKE